jgi:hypothetical protein
MTDSLATVERCATVAQPSLADLGTYVASCTGMDGEELGEYVERNWDTAVGNALGLMFLVKEMKRKFSLLDRKKQVNGTYKTIRGFASFDKWFTSFTGKSRRLAYYLLETEEQKHKRNAERRTNEKKKDTDFATFVARCGDAKKKLAEIQRQIEKPFNRHKPDETRDWNALYEQISPTIHEVLQEFLALISPEGYEILRSDDGWRVTKKDEDEDQDQILEALVRKKAKRSAAATKEAATRAAKANSLDGLKASVAERKAAKDAEKYVDPEEEKKAQLVRIENARKKRIDEAQAKHANPTESEYENVETFADPSCPQDRIRAWYGEFMGTFAWGSEDEHDRLWRQFLSEKEAAKPQVAVVLSGERPTEEGAQ